MRVVFRGRCLTASLALIIGALPIVPPEHVHHVEDHGHPHNLVHRHAAPHSGQSHAAHHQTRVDDDDAPILTLDALFTVTPVTRIVVAMHQSTPVVDEPPLAVVLGTPEFFERLIHGPPRAPAGLRAPPSTAFL